MKYYAERNGLMEKDLDISFKELKRYFFQIYQYFESKNYFEAAINGIWITPQWGDSYQKIPPLLAPSPEIFFLNHLLSSRIYPIYDYYERYTEEQLFTVIEIMYDNICLYNYKDNILETDTPRKEFATQINNILQFYKNGYFLETNSGTISSGSNSPLKKMLSEDLSQVLESDIMKKMRTAIKMYYRYDSDIELKKKAINILADILEPLREELKNILNSKYLVNKNIHDKLIFDIVNNFNIRHNNSRQYTQYEIEIWYDWMMQYYASVIITYYKLKKIYEN